MKTSLPPRKNAATLIEVILVLVTFVILAALLLPALSHTGSHRTIHCVSNLKQIGLGWLTWMHDHDIGEFPFRVPVANGGTMGSADPLKNSAWFQFSVISNELNSPRMLVCPDDKDVGQARKIATHWDPTDKNGGFMSPGFRDRATSYTIALDTAQSLDSGDVGSRIVGSDRNIVFDKANSNCSSGLTDTRSVRARGKNGPNASATAGWTSAIHRLRGNVLSLDGSVQQTSTRDLDALLDLSDDNGSIHFLVPK